MLALNSYAQQDPQFTHYMYNMSVLNPAYATDNKDVINLGGMYREQWVGIEGAPSTVTSNLVPLSQPLPVTKLA